VGDFALLLTGLRINAKCAVLAGWVQL